MIQKLTLIFSKIKSDFIFFWSNCSIEISSLIMSIIGLIHSFIKEIQKCMHNLSETKTNGLDKLQSLEILIAKEWEKLNLLIKKED